MPFTHAASPILYRVTKIYKIRAAATLTSSEALDNFLSRCSTGNKFKKICLQEALKFNYEHAGMWENYMLLCADTQDVADGKHQDDEVIAIVTSQLLELRSVSSVVLFDVY
uniref:Uncharacterized protein n=1 Tax=Parascaris equorum TaxID=6256 RepID=A0A914RHH1_PAREQ